MYTLKLISVGSLCFLVRLCFSAICFDENGGKVFPFRRGKRNLLKLNFFTTLFPEAGAPVFCLLK